jgi:hypothetical protein
MPKSHRPYPLEYRRRMVEMVRAGKTPEELSRQFEVSGERRLLLAVLLDAFEILQCLGDSSSSGA